jgi:hypothetical protein
MNAVSPRQYRFKPFSFRPCRFTSGLVFGCMVSVLGLAATSASALPVVKVLRGANQQTTYGSAFPAPLVVWATDPVTERSVAGLRVDFTPGAGIGLNSTFAFTDDRGLASVTATGLTACISSVHAEVAGMPSLKVSFDGLEVDKAVLTVVPADLTSEQGAQVPAIANYMITGFVNGDTADTAGITGAPVLTTTATDRSPHANYAIKGSVGTLSAPNYTFVAGFGTLAVLDGPNPGEPLQAVPFKPLREEERVSVRSALLNQPGAETVPLPAFVAGLRGESGVFVVNAIWPDSAHTPQRPQTLLARTALPEVEMDIRKSQEVPVRAVEMPKIVIASVATSRISDTRSALTAVAVTAPKGLDASVRAVILPSQATVYSSAQPISSGAKIRKAFVSPGTN